MSMMVNEAIVAALTLAPKPHPSLSHIDGKLVLKVSDSREVAPDATIRPSIAVILSLLAVIFAVSADSVNYDSRSLLINGKGYLIFSGSIHYPRSTPEFIKTIQQSGMYAVLQIGPFTEAEWIFGGLPYWLKEILGIIFRTDNEPFKFHTQQFTQYIVDMMKFENLYASQVCPVILSQIQNEYNNVAKAFNEGGDKYVQCAGNMAVSMNIGVPWVMCKEKHALGEVASYS